MAGDWIKVRTDLTSNPRVNGIARFLEQHPPASRALCPGHNGAPGDVMSRVTLRAVTVSLLVSVWGAANEHTEDGTFHHCDLRDIDDLAGVAGFGEAMQSVGWALESTDDQTGQAIVLLPNFGEWNTTGKSRAAERQRRYRERQRDVTRDVTRDDNESRNVTPPARESRVEEREGGEGRACAREGESCNEDASTKSSSSKQTAQRFEEWWQHYPRKKGRKPCKEIWRRKQLDQKADQLIADTCARQVHDDQWVRGYAPNPQTYLNQERWEDDYDQPRQAPADSFAHAPSGPAERARQQAYEYLRDNGLLESTG